MGNFNSILGTLLTGSYPELAQNPRDFPRTSHNEQVPFCDTFRACLYGDPTNTRPYPPPAYIGFMVAYRVQCRTEALDPDSFQWHQTPLSYALFSVVVHANPQSVTVLPFFPSSVFPLTSPKSDLSPELWELVSTQVWAKLSAMMGIKLGQPSNEFKPYLEAEYPKRIKPLVAMWLNEVRIFDYATEIEMGFEGMWMRAPTSSRSPPDIAQDGAAERIALRDVALSPTEFIPAELCVDVFIIVEHSTNWNCRSVRELESCLIKLVISRNAGVFDHIQLGRPYGSANLRRWIHDVAISKLWRRAACDLSLSAGQFMLSITAWVRTTTFAMLL